MEDNKYIFVIGHGRSGTTLLNKALASHPDICFINNEFNDFPFFYLNQILYNKYKEEKYQKMTEDFCLHPWIKIKGIVNPAKNFKDFFQGIMNYYRQDLKRNIIGIKIANNIRQNVDMIKNEFPDAYVIHIYRDPRDVYLSVRKTNFGTKSALYAGKSWCEAIQSISKLHSIEHYHEIKYETFISEPEKELKRLCNFLNIEYHDGMLHFNKQIDRTIPYYEKNHLLLRDGFVKDNFNKWKKELDMGQLRLIYYYTYRYMKKYGYDEGIFKVNDVSIFRRAFEFVYDKACVMNKRIRLDRRMSLNHRAYFNKIISRRKVL